MNVPPKVKCFIWRLMHRRLSCRQNFERREIHLISLSCPFCNLEIETIEHVFFLCHSAFQIWSECYHWLDECTVMPNSVDIHFLKHRGSTSSKTTGHMRWVLWAPVLRNIWKTRNNRTMSLLIKSIQDMKFFGWFWLKNLMCVDVGTFAQWQLNMKVIS